MAIPAALQVAPIPESGATTLAAPRVVRMATASLQLATMPKGPMAKAPNVVALATIPAMVTIPEDRCNGDGYAPRQHLHRHLFWLAAGEFF